MKKRKTETLSLLRNFDASPTSLGSYSYVFDKNNDETKIFCDGGTKNNGQPNQKSRIAVWAEGRVLVENEVGNRTNNEAEYLALIAGLEYARGRFRGKKVIFFVDSRLVVNQISGRWRVKTPHLFPYMRRARSLLFRLGRDLRWIPREVNRAGVYLEEKYNL